MVEEEESLCCVPPPGFRFHPTEEELVGYYLARKVAPSTSPHKTTMDIIQEVDLHTMEPWDLQRMLCSSSSKNGGECCYFFSHKDRKYPGGTRTNRATAVGFWKATGRDKPVLSSSRGGGGGGRVIIIGMRKTLVFYEGRAPNGRRTDWIMHEYRLHSNLPAAAQAKEEASWVVCRAFQKPIPNQQSLHHHPYPCGGYDDHHRFLVGSTPPLPQLMDDEQLLIQQQQQQQEGGGGGAAVTTTIDWNWNFLDSLLLSSSTPASSQLAPP